jgi:colicin import membrane protein
MNKAFALLLSACLTLLAVPALGQAEAGLAVAPGGLVVGLSPEAERARIKEERAMVEDVFTQAQVACYRKFAVTDCQGEARLIRREALADLRRQEASLNAALARQKGAEQLSRIDSRSSNEAELENAGRRAQALEKQQARQLGVDEKASARAAALLEINPLTADGSLRDEKKSQSQADRAAKAQAAALEQEKYELKQKQAREKAVQRQKRRSGQPESTGKAPLNPT